MRNKQFKGLLAGANRGKQEKATTNKGGRGVEKEKCGRKQEVRSQAVCFVRVANVDVHFTGSITPSYHQANFYEEVRELQRDRLATDSTQHPVLCHGPACLSFLSAPRVDSLYITLFTKYTNKVYFSEPIRLILLIHGVILKEHK